MFTYLKNATFHEAFDLDVFMPSILSKHDSSVYKSERKTLLNDLFIFIQKNQGDNALIAEALISVSFVIVFLVAVLYVVYKIDKN